MFTLYGHIKKKVAEMRLGRGWFGGGGGYSYSNMAIRTGAYTGGRGEFLANLVNICEILDPPPPWTS